MSAAVPKPLGILPLGDAAAYVEFAESLDMEVNAAGERGAQGTPGGNDPALCAGRTQVNAPRGRRRSWRASRSSLM